jgi:hypothetical protein
MDNRILLGLLVLAVFAGSVSAAPFTIKASVNGVDPSADTAVVKAGEAATVSVQVDMTSPNVEVTQVEFESTPSAMGGILEAFLESRVEFPYKLKNIDDTNSYELPGLVPAGDYDITAKVHYTGDRQGVYEYKAKLKVENEGLLSMILGLLSKILPKSIIKPLAGAIL